MTSMNPPAGNENWQERYSALESQWQDLKRIREFTLVISVLTLVATLYTIGYTSNKFEYWLLETPSQFWFYILLLRILMIRLTPLIALLAGLRLIFNHSSEIVLSVYQSGRDEAVSSIIWRRLFGLPPVPPPLNLILKYPPILITTPKLKENHWARWFGGPATLVIYDGIAVYLERGNKFSRVVGPGIPMPFLERYERIKEVIDLRPQTRGGFVEPWTKDGIRIKLTIKAEVQINASDHALEKSSKFRYPFDPLAVKAAVEYTSVRLIDGKLQEQSWLEGAWGAITGEINKFVAGHSLDELFIAPRAENHPNSNQQKDETLENIEQIFSQKISEQVINKVRENLRKNGINVLNIQITQFDAPPEVLDLRTRYWESVKLKISAQRNSRAEAEWIRAREQARAEAQRTMLMTITKKLENIDPDDLTEPLILSLSGILDQNLDDPIVRPLIAKESFAVLERMRKMLQERF